MPKVVKGGIFSSKIFLKKIPLGLKTECGFCFAQLETTEEDLKKSEFTKKSRKIQGGKIFVLGWTLKCPECGKNVFFVCPKMTDELYEKANGWNS